MSDLCFADRYAESGLSPGSDIIGARQTTFDRIKKSIESKHVIDLTAYYFGDTDVDLSWFVEEFRNDDLSFSLVSNQREALILAALILTDRVMNGDNRAILAVLTGSMGGKRQPVEAAWLVADANAAFLQRAISARTFPAVDAKLKLHATPKLADEIAAIEADDWAHLTTVLGKVRAEQQEAAKSMGAQLNGILEGLIKQVALVREENQILWWLYGQSSTILNRPFKSLPPELLALVAGMELVSLSTRSWLGPAAGPVLLERAVSLSAPTKKTEVVLATLLDQLEPSDLELLQTCRNGRPARLFPIMTAIEKRKEIGAGNWHTTFEKVAGLNPDQKFLPSALAVQVYSEYLLGRFE